MNKQLAFIYVFITLLVGCKPYQSTTTTQAGKYSEDLSSLRPKIQSPADSVSNSQPIKKTTYVEPRYNVNRQLDNVLDSINHINLNRKVVDGFTIQVYSGLDREAALNAKKSLTTSLPDLESEVQYNQPNFRVKAGKYFNRLDAQKDFIAIKKVFPSAIVIPDKIEIN
ncbi:MAG TPA: hypothetical protein VFW11_22945 [Cyclobacteriaceae bacterium]|nr:hypothetical protein [Cyclobacteriaceae bacterium]